MISLADQQLSRHSHARLRSSSIAAPSDSLSPHSETDQRFYVTTLAVEPWHHVTAPLPTSRNEPLSTFGVKDENGNFADSVDCPHLHAVREPTSDTSGAAPRHMGRCEFAPTTPPCMRAQAKYSKRSRPVCGHL